jgi:hypothetical protein
MSPDLPFDVEDERHAALTADEEAIIQATHQLHGVDGTVGKTVASWESSPRKSIDCKHAAVL